jgi:hypothetical protein
MCVEASRSDVHHLCEPALARRLAGGVSDASHPPAEADGPVRQLTVRNALRRVSAPAFFGVLVAVSSSRA